MISWHINSFNYVPLNVNVLSTQGIIDGLGQLSMCQETVRCMKDLCEQKGEPVVFDFLGLAIPSKELFVIFKNASINRPVIFLNVSSVSVKRLKDDGVTLQNAGSSSGDELHFCVGAGTPHTSCIDEVIALNGRFAHTYMKLKEEALSECNEVLKSTPVYATKYYDAKKLFVDEAVLQVVATSLATAILHEKIDFEYVVSSSSTGAFLAVPISSLLGKSLHCWTDLGPEFNPKRKMEWTAGKGKKCLLVADFICMGTEIRTAQAYITSSGSQLVACAAIAAYLPPEIKKLPCVSLLNRVDLEDMGYKLEIPTRESC